MIRTLITPQQQIISIQIPPDFVGKKVEVIAFAIDDTTETTIDKPLTYLASEKVLAKDWLTPEEDIAWKDL